MSVKAMSWAFEQRLSGNEKCVLLALADRARDDGVCWPGQEETARKAFVSVRTVSRILGKLEAEGYLSRQPRYRENGSRTSDLTVLNMGQPDNLSGHLPDKPDEANRTTVSGPEPPLTTEPSTLMEIPQQLVTTQASVDGCSRNIDRVWTAYVETRRSVLGPERAARLTAGRRDLLRRRLTNWPVDDLIDAVRGWAKSPHNCGENERGTPYCDPELILRDAAHIERFRDLQRHGPLAPVHPIRSNGSVYPGRDRKGDDGHDAERLRAMRLRMEAMEAGASA
jgi:hypothetical protein